MLYDSNNNIYNYIKLVESFNFILEILLDVE